ncbi:MAG: DUF998 domain-containing protein [Bacteroidota bacterium]|nr:DUF998 domain-containing protein [Bacteroidota bacterium]MDP4233185.1 DUF998 domain-containing protein [Bacteroidota bacterium]MDP4242196.1 DUF998 domain-containing protein [Bacteroidota bacterium]MDP4289400.1 DUF998 domain-containing protein [Bacteroidota bacterium]
MATTTVDYVRVMHPAPASGAQSKWQRITLVSVLGYEALGCLVGGSFLVAAPEGSLMDMPVSIMHGTFPDFLIPGMILFALGLLNAAAFFAVFRRSHADWLMAGLALGGLTIWFWVEIAILLELHWLHAMWGLPVLLGGLVAIPLLPDREETLRKGFLIGGILASLLYVAINIIVALQWPTYNSASQTVSELSAVNAPTRTLWLVLSTPYTFLMMAFGWGVWQSARGSRPLRIAGDLLLAYAALGLLWPLAPMHLRETLAAGGATFSDTLHLTLGAVTEVLYLCALGFAAKALGKSFRVYSLATFVVLLVFGILTFLDAPGLSTNQPTPMIGVWERINIGVFLLWVVVLAIELLPLQNTAASK